MHWFYRGWTRSQKKKKTVRIGQQKINSRFSFFMVGVNVSRPSLIGSMLLWSCLLTQKVTKLDTVCGSY